MNVRPLVPEDIDRDARGRAAMTSLARACIASARSTLNPAVYGSESNVLRNFQRDVIARAIVTKAPVSPTDTSSALSHQVVADIFTALTPASAGAAILDAGLSLRFDGAAVLSVPTVSADPTLARFVGQGAAIPVVQGQVEPPVFLHPRKLSSIMVMSREQIESSNAEVLFTDALIRSTALALDQVLLGPTPDDGVNPPGLRAGIVASAASSATDPVEAMMLDLETLLGTVMKITAAPPLLVAAPARAIVMQLRAPHGLSPLTVLGSPALKQDEVVCIAPVAVVSASDALPEVESSREAVLNLETQPLPIVDESGKVAVPVGSLFQSDTIGTRIKHPVDWAIRDPRGCAWLQATGW